MTGGQLTRGPDNPLSEPGTATVSVIIPCHDRSEFVRSSVRTVLDQTHRPIEIIVVDDGSTEPVLDVAESELAEVTGITYHLLSTEENVGPGGAREVGRRRASGDYVCYLDSDDLWHPTKLAQQIDRLREVGADMCYTAVGVFAGRPDPTDAELRPRSDLAFDSVLPELLFGRPWSTSSVMWTRDAVARIGSWLPEWSWEDYAYDCRAGTLGSKVISCAEVLTYHRREGAAGQHVSEVPDDRSTISQGRCLLSMHRDLVSTDLLHEDRTRRRMAELLVRSAFACLDSGDQELAQRLLRTLRSRPFGPAVRVVAATLGVAALVLPSGPLKRTRIRLVRLVRRLA